MFRFAFGILVCLGVTAANGKEPSTQPSAQYATLLEAIRPLARVGMPQAQGLLGAMYLEGKGVSQDYSEAKSWLDKAADHGSREAGFLLGLIYENGWGVARDPNQSARWYLAAAVRGHAEAQNAIAGKYASGAGVEQNDKAAARWLYRAAQQGVVVAQLALADDFARGSGVAKDELMALWWATIAEANARRPADRDKAVALQNSAGASASDEQKADFQARVRGWTPVLESTRDSWTLVKHEQDGIGASLGIDSDQVLVRWRDIGRPIAMFDEVGLKIEGRPLASRSIEPFSSATAKTAALLLLDASDPARNPQFQQQKEMLNEVAARAQGRAELDVVTYAGGIDLAAELLQPDSNSLGALKQTVNRIEARSQPANLGKALAAAIELPTLVRAQRRAIFVFTSGNSDDQLDTTNLRRLADENFASINFVVAGSGIPVARPLTELAHMTGGVVVDGTNFQYFARAPFALFDSGGAARFPINLRTRWFWESAPKLELVLRYRSRDVANGALEMGATIPLPVAGAGQTGKFVVKQWPVATSGCGIALAAVAAGSVFLRRRRRAEVADESLPVLATLESLADGTKHPIRSTIRIGRNSSNNLVLARKTVSRRHAVIESAGNGVFRIENRSKTNPTLVNDKPADKTPLNDGDVISIGDVKLRFSAAAGETP